MNLTSSQWADIIIIAYLVISIIVGYIKGFFRSVVGFVVAGLSVFIGYLVAPSFVDPVTDWLYPKAKDFLLKVAETNLSLPEDYALTPEQMEELVRPMLEPLSKVVIWVVVGLISAVLLSIIGNLVARKVDSNEVLRRTDRKLGSLLGLVESVAICFLIAIVIARLGLAENLYETLKDSVIINFINKFIPDNLESIKITLPIVGDINLNELFKGIEIRFK